MKSSNHGQFGASQTRSLRRSSNWSRSRNSRRRQNWANFWKPGSLSPSSLRGGLGADRFFFTLANLSRRLTYSWTDFLQARFSLLIRLIPVPWVARFSIGTSGCSMRAGRRCLLRRKAYVPLRLLCRWFPYQQERERWPSLPLYLESFERSDEPG
jgi:hypothetical protein